jgi:hypothetical protein
MHNIFDKIKQQHIIDKDDRVSTEIVETRIQICRNCSYFYEDSWSVRCYACKCNNNFYLKKSGVCPMKTPKWE